ncbi:MAG: RNA ligase family protein [Cyanobium sp.]
MKPVASLTIDKYPRTQHIRGSRLQPGDEDLEAVPFSRIAGRHIVVEEKVDGANVGIRFSTAGELLLQSRGHYLSGGPREKHFTLFKQWATTLQGALADRLGHRHVLYGEWLYAKHTVFYDRLPHYLMEFDVLDTTAGMFLDTPRRAALLAGLPLPAVRVLFSGTLRRLEDLTALVGPSHFIVAGHLDRLRADTERLGIDAERAVRETDPSTLMEGLYIKVEEDGVVKERYKFVRADFIAAIARADGHWLERPIVPNRLAEGVDLFAAG